MAAARPRCAGSRGTQPEAMRCCRTTTRVRAAMSPTRRSASALIRRTSCPAWVINRPANVNSAKRSRFGRAGEHRDGAFQGHRPAVLGRREDRGTQGRSRDLRRRQLDPVACHGRPPAASGRLPAPLAVREPRDDVRAELGRRRRAQGRAGDGRLREFQKERGLDDAAALAGYYRERLPEVARPETVEQQLALLREREPMPDALLADLARRRVETTRRRLLEAEGISAARLTGEEASSGSTAPTPAATGEGRVELGIVAGE